jgi:hypothetical protein
MTKNTAWFFLLIFVSMTVAQQDTIPSGVSRNKPGTPAVLHLNAKGILIQTSVTDESVDTGGALPASILKPQVTDTNKNLREPTLSPVNPKSNSAIQGKPGIEYSVSSARAVSEVLKTREMFVELGKYHKFLGAYGVICGALGIIAGVILLDKPDDTPFAMAFIPLGGISIGFGLWEINVGGKLLKYGTADK